jgi:hypothetical protein
MPATIDRVGPFYFVGTLDRPRAGRVTIRVTAKPLNAFGRLLGSPGTTRALDTPGHRPLNAIALTRHGEHVLRVQPQQACNRWVDYVQPPGSPGAP